MVCIDTLGSVLDKIAGEAAVIGGTCMGVALDEDS